MKIPGFVKQLLVLFAVVLIGGGVFAWKKALPVMLELSEKNPQKFATMLAEAKSFHFQEARRLYSELDGMTYEEVLVHRYHSWKKDSWQDDKIRLNHWEKEWEAREEARELRRKASQQQINDLIAVSGGEKRNAGFMDWQKAGPWEKGLLLREKCIKYLEIEKEESLGRKNLRKLAQVDGLLSKPGEESLTIPELCEDLVLISHDEREVFLALEKLKNKMNYFFFVQLLDETGIPRQDVFSLPAQLNRMTGGFTDS